MREVDNRNMEDMLAYYEARIEMLSKHIRELESELTESRFHAALFLSETLDKVRASDLQGKL